MVPQSSSTQPGAADTAEHPEGDLFDQIKSLFNKNTETMNQIAELNTAQTELAISKKLRTILW